MYKSLRNYRQHNGSQGVAYFFVAEVQRIKMKTAQLESFVIFVLSNMYNFRTKLAGKRRPPSHYAHVLRGCSRRTRVAVRHVLANAPCLRTTHGNRCRAVLSETARLVRAGKTTQKRCAIGLRSAERDEPSGTPSRPSGRVNQDDTAVVFGARRRDRKLFFYSGVYCACGRLAGGGGGREEKVDA